MVTVWRLRGNIIRTAPCWVVWHNVHSQQLIHISSSYRSSGLGLSHCHILGLIFSYVFCLGGCEFGCQSIAKSCLWNDFLSSGTSNSGHLSCASSAFNCPTFQSADAPILVTACPHCSQCRPGFQHRYENHSSFWRDKVYPDIRRASALASALKWSTHLSLAKMWPIIGNNGNGTR